MSNDIIHVEIMREIASTINDVIALEISRDTRWEVNSTTHWEVNNIFYNVTYIATNVFLYEL